MTIKHYVVVGVSFIGGALLAPGSRVTSLDLGTYRDPKDGKEKPVTPGEQLVEIDDRGYPIDEADYPRLQAIASELVPPNIAAVSPFAPNPTKAQGAPAQPPGGVQVAYNTQRTAPAVGVESEAAAEARAEQQDNASATTAAILRQPHAEAPKRRAGTAAKAPAGRGAKGPAPAASPAPSPPPPPGSEG